MDEAAERTPFKNPWQRKDAPPAPYLLRYRSSKWFILITICLALFTDSFIYGVLVPVIPFLLIERGHVSDGTEQLWTSALFALFGFAILIGSPVCGWYADRTTSRRLPILFSLPILAVATALLGASNNIYMLLFSRFLQGASTAIVWTVGLALVKDTVGKDEVGQWMGTALSSSSIGLVVSPMLGGTVYFKAGLWGVLGMMIGLICLNIIMVVSMIEKRVAKRYDIPRPRRAGRKKSRSVYNTFRSEHVYEPLKGVVNVRRSFDRRPSSVIPNQIDVTADLPHPRTATPATTNEAQPLLSSTTSKRDKAPMLRLLKSPRVMTGAFGVFTQFGLLASFDAFLPLFVERRFDWGSLGAGLIFLNIAIPALCGPLAGKLSDKYGPRKVALAGCILTAPPLVCLRFVGDDTMGNKVLLCAMLVLIGFFLTLIISPLAADLSFAVDQIEFDHPGVFGEQGAYAQAYALFNCAMAAATVVGPLLAGAVQDQFGTSTVAWVLAVWCFSAGIPVLFFISDDVPVPGDVEPEEQDDDENDDDDD